MDKKERQREYSRRKREEAKLAYAAFIPYYPLTLDDLDGEIWKDIEGFNGDYQIPNFGRVKSFKYKTPRILKPGLQGDYLRVDLCIGNEPKHCPMHILVATAFIPNPYNKPEVNQIIGHKFNCHVDNLEWNTDSENAKHAYDTGLAKAAQGIEDSNAKIKNKTDIICIRDNPDNLETKQLAAMFGVSETTIRDIQRGKVYPNEGGTFRRKVVHRISDEIKKQIREDWATGNYTYAQLAEKYGLHKVTIGRIIREGQKSSSPAKTTLTPVQTATL